MTKSREYLRKLCNPAYKIWWCTLRGARGAHCAPLQGGTSGIRGTGDARQQATGDTTVGAAIGRPPHQTAVLNDINEKRRNTLVNPRIIG